MSWLNTLITKATAKAAAGTAVAVIGIGGLAVAGAQIPETPGDEPEATDEVVDETEDADDREEVVDDVEDGDDTSDDTTPEAPEDDADDAPDDDQAPDGERRVAVEAFTVAVADWGECVSDAAQAKGEEEAFNPFEACGERPMPFDFGVVDVPEQAQAGQDRAAEARENRGDDDADDETGDDADIPDDDSADSGDAADAEGRANAEEARQNHSGAADRGAEAPGRGGRP